MRRCRGSALVFVLILVIAITTVIVATGELTMGAQRAQSRREKDAAARRALEGAVAQLVSEYLRGDFALPVKKDIKIGEATVTAEVTDNSAHLPKTMRIDTVTVAGGAAYRASRVVGSTRPTPSPFYYALAANSTVDFDFSLTTGSGGSNGDVYVTGDIDSDEAFTNTINGDLETTGKVKTGRFNVLGTEWAGAPPVAFPTMNRADYLAAANQVLVAGIINGWVFVSVGGNDPLLYVVGNATIKGAFSGRGTIYVGGDADIIEDMFYVTSDSKLAILVEGRITVKREAKEIVGYLYAREFEAEERTKTLSRGSVAAATVKLLCNFTVTHDPAVWTDPNEGKKLKLPGFWP